MKRKLISSETFQFQEDHQTKITQAQETDFLLLSGLKSMSPEVDTTATGLQKLKMHCKRQNKTQ